MKTNVTQEKVIARIVKGGFNEKEAKEMVPKFWELAERMGCRTVREFYEEITWFWAVD